MKLTKVLMVLAIVVTGALTACSPKDADIKTAIEEKIKPTGAVADVKDGVATLTGEVMDADAKAMAEKEAGAVKGVKSVINNITIAAPPPPPMAPVVISADDPLKQSVTDALKDYSSVKADVKDGIVTLTGEIKKDDLKKLMQNLQSLKPKKVDSKQLTVK